MTSDKRYYTRYKAFLEGRVEARIGVLLPIEVLDVSIEGARLKTSSRIPLKEGEVVNMVIKWKTPIKAKAEVKWVKDNDFFMELGVKFKEMDTTSKKALLFLISDLALPSPSDVYFL